MRKSARLSLEQVLSLVVVAEDYRSRCYREWSERFLPYDSATSRLLQQLSAEDRQDGTRFAALAERLLGTQRIPAEITHFGHLVPECRTISTEHFFVVNDEMGRCILESAVKMERQANLFHEWCAEQCGTCPATGLLSELAEHNLQHAAVLHEALERFHVHRASRLRRAAHGGAVQSLA